MKHIKQGPSVQELSNGDNKILSVSSNVFGNGGGHGGDSPVKSFADIGLNLNLGQSGKKPDYSVNSMASRYITSPRDYAGEPRDIYGSGSRRIIEENSQYLDQNQQDGNSEDEVDRTNLDPKIGKRKKQKKVYTYDFMAQKLTNIDSHIGKVQKQKKNIVNNHRDKFFFEIDKVNVTRMLRKALIEAFLKRDLYDLQCKRWVVLLRTVLVLQGIEDEYQYMEDYYENIRKMYAISIYKHLTQL